MVFQMRMCMAVSSLIFAVGVGMAAATIGLGGAVSAQDLAPVYLRLSQAERERLARLNEEAK